jgi:hypothetical protein
MSIYYNSIFVLIAFQFLSIIILLDIQQKNIKLSSNDALTSIDRSLSSHHCHCKSLNRVPHTRRGRHVRSERLMYIIIIDS